MNFVVFLGSVIGKIMLHLIKKIFIATFLFISVGCTHSSVSEINDFEPIIAQAKIVSPSNSLILFDVDGILIVPCENDLFEFTIRENILLSLTKNLPLDEQYKIRDAVFLNRKIELPDQRILELMRLIKERKINAAALTNMAPFSSVAIKDSKIMRHSELKKLGIDFTTLFSDLRYFSWPDLRKSKKTDAPAMKYGIVFAAGVQKGMILKRFLRDTKLTPNTIIFVDDKEKNIKSMQVACKELRIIFFGYLYKGFAKRNRPTLDREFEQKRIEILVNQKQWLSREQIQNNTNISNKN